MRGKTINGLLRRTNHARTSDEALEPIHKGRARVEMSCDKCKDNHPTFTNSTASDISYTYSARFDADGVTIGTAHAFDTSSSNIILSDSTASYTVEECLCDCHEICEGCEDCKGE